MSQTNEINILLVEDDGLDGKAAKRCLDKADFACNVHVAASFDEAIQALRTNQFDVALVDYKLGDHDGLELLEMLVDIPAIMVTGSGNEDVAVQAMQKGAYDYLIKDGRGDYLDLLPQVLCNVVQRKSIERERQQLIVDLQKALDEVKTLQGLIPICCRCKKMKDENGYWSEIEVYLSKHSQASLSHGLCESCYDEWEKELDADEANEAGDPAG